MIKLEFTYSIVSCDYWNSS